MTDVEKLKQIIDEIDILISKKVKSYDQKFKEWHYKTKHFLSKKYGSDSTEYKDFTEISFNYDFPTMYDDNIEVCHQGLDSAKAMLNALLTDFSDENTDNENVYYYEKELERIFTRFRKVAVRLARRYNGRETLRITDEYDVQDLLHSLLSLYYDDIRPEEWTPSYAGSSVRIDFVIPEIKTFIEVKKTRSGLKDKELRDQLIIDIEQYQKHSGCDKIYCFVYDPDTILKNPAAIKKDLEEKHQGLVRVFIES